jgi:hypothetical protein
MTIRYKYALQKGNVRRQAGENPPDFTDCG